MPSGPSPAQGGLLLPPAETCADNPLLAKCSPPRAEAEPAPTPNVPPPPSLDLDPSLTPVERAEAVLGARCGSCHGPNDLRTCGVCDGLRNIDDMGKMIESGKIIPCRWTDSPIAQRIARREMPPDYSGAAPPSREEISLLRTFVDGLCDDLTAGGPVVSGRTAIESWLASDCGSCHGNAPADAGASAGERVPLLDVAELVVQGVILPCNPEGSLLVQRLRDDSMPPPGVSPRPTASELSDLVAFIDRPCSRR
jgi:mono/diheme cytochrome c family protein